MKWKIDRNGNKALRGIIGAERTRATEFEQDLWARVQELESMLVSRTKEVDAWIERYDRNIAKQRDIIQTLQSEQESGLS